MSFRASGALGFGNSRAILNSIARTLAGRVARVGEYVGATGASAL
jgi:hypothetical protein